MTTVAEISSIQRRFCAYLIDMAILSIPGLLITILFKNLPLIFDLSCICMHCTYFTYFISSNAQATPGQQLMNICTVNIDNSKIDLSLAFDRSIFQFFLPLLNIVLLIYMEFLEDNDVLVNILNILKGSIML